MVLAPKERNEQVWEWDGQYRLLVLVRCELVEPHWLGRWDDVIDHQSERQEVLMTE